MGDGVDRLCKALYHRGPKAADYLGGSDATMLHDAASMIESFTSVRGEISKARERMSDVRGRFETLRKVNDLGRAQVVNLQSALGETLDRLLAFVDRDRQDGDDLAILDETIEKANAALGSFPSIRKSDEAERLKAALDAALVEAKWIYDEGHFDDAHMDDCPEDDSCECEWVIRINLLFAILEQRRDVEARLRERLDGEARQ